MADPQVLDDEIEIQSITPTEPNSPPSERDELTNSKGAKMNRKQRILKKISVGGLGLVILLGLIYYFTSSRNSSKICQLVQNGSTSEMQSICMTPECIYAASKTIKYMDSTVKPCNNFYRFSCGNFVDSALLPDDTVIVNTLDKTYDTYQNQLRTIVEEKIQPEEPNIYKLVKTIYKNCMNKEKNISTALNVIKKIGGWPVLEGNLWQDKNYQWEETIYNLKAEGLSISSLFSLSLESNFMNEDQFVLNIDQATFLLPIKVLKNGLQNLNVESYYKYMIDVSILLGANKTDAMEELLDSLNFEIQLATIAMENKADSYNPMTLKELEGNYTTIPWRKFFNQLVGPKVKINGNTAVIVHTSDSYWRQLEMLLQKTSNRIQANYFAWRAIASIATHLSEDIRRSELKFFAETSGLIEPEPRWKECVTFLGTQVEPLVSAFYIKKYFNEETKTSATEVVTNVKKQFVQFLNDIRSPTKMGTKEIESMKTHIGYPEYLLDLEFLETLYKDLEITSGTYLQTYLNLTLFQTNYSFNKLTNHETITDVIESSPTNFERPILHISYSFRRNSLFIPAGILQEEFFNINRPQYINYGTLGLSAARKITSGFIDFLQKQRIDLDCLVQKYTASNSKLKRKDVSLEKTVADNEAIKVAYYAYQEWTKNQPEPKLPGLDFTPQQLFWITAAQIWCSESIETESFYSDSYNMKITFERSNPVKFRILTSFSNMPEFSNDFNCSKNTVMNPAVRCSS